MSNTQFTKNNLLPDSASGPDAAEETLIQIANAADVVTTGMGALKSEYKSTLETLLAKRAEHKAARKR